MSKSTKYLDVNKEQYLEALFIDLEKNSKKMVSFDDRAKMIHDFVMGNSSNDDISVTNNGLTIVNGKVLIKSRKKSKK